MSYKYFSKKKSLSRIFGKAFLGMERSIFIIILWKLKNDSLMTSELFVEKFFIDSQELGFVSLYETQDEERVNVLRYILR